jgi:SAM-dependent methyltransferase
MNAESEQVIEAAQGFVRQAEATDRALRRQGDTVPSSETRQTLAASFWALVAALDQYEQAGGSDPEALGRRCRDIVSGWLFRSRYFNRSYHKPHGYAGDFRMVEWMYDLEGNDCADPTQPGIVNCLDHLFSTVHSVQSLWERRRWLLHLLRGEYQRRGGRLRVLDIACGGARYVADFLAAVPDTADVHFTLVDQDPAALAYCRTTSLARWLPRLSTHCLPIKRLGETVHQGEFDVVLSAGLFDYLDEAPARHLLAHLGAVTAADGVLAITNFHPLDPSRLVKQWLVDWPLVYRDERACLGLFPDPAQAQVRRSDNGALLYAWARH